MDKKELKSVIKEMVRQSLMEIFAEMHLETIVESVVRKQKPAQAAQKQQLREQFVAEQEQEEERPVVRQTAKPAPKVDEAKQKALLREEMRKKLGVSDEAWKLYYSDIDPTKLPPGASSPGANENPESVPEDLLEAAGLMRDYSEFIK